MTLRSRLLPFTLVCSVACGGPEAEAPEEVRPPPGPSRCELAQGVNTPAVDVKHPRDLPVDCELTGVSNEYYAIDQVPGLSYVVTVTPSDGGYVILNAWDHLPLADDGRNSLTWPAFTSETARLSTQTFTSGGGVAAIAPFKIIVRTVPTPAYEDEHPGAIDAATPIALDETKAITLDSPADVDAFRFEAVAGRSYIVTAASAELRPRIDFYSADGQPMEGDEGTISASSTAPIVFTLWRRNGTQQSYAVKVIELADGAGQTQAEATPYEDLPDNFLGVDDVDYYALTMDAGETIKVALSSRRDAAVFALEGIAAGTEVRADVSDAGLVYRAEYTATEAGIAYVRVSASKPERYWLSVGRY